MRNSTRESDERATYLRRWVIALGAGLLACLANVAPAGAQKASVLLVNVAEVGTGAPVSGAEVLVFGLGRRAHTDSTGEARLAGIPAGTYEVRVRRIGFSATSLLVPLERDSTTLAVLLRPAVATLDTVHVRESAIVADEHRQFELRRRRGLGRFLGPDDLEKANMLEFPVVAAEHFPGLALITGRAGQWQLASRHGTCGVDTTYEVLNSAGSTLRNMPTANLMTGAGSGARQTVGEAATSPSSCFSDHPCHIKLFLDDQPVAESDIGIVHTDELYGVEYYSAGNAPPRYRVSGSACGVMLLWTKRGNSG